MGKGLAQEHSSTGSGSSHPQSPAQTLLSAVTAPAAGTETLTYFLFELQKGPLGWLDPCQLGGWRCGAAVGCCYAGQLSPLPQSCSQPPLNTGAPEAQTALQESITE